MESLLNQDLSATTIATAIFITTVVILISTRFLSASQPGAINPAAHSGSSPPQVPYWFPIFGHWFSINGDPGLFLEESKAVYPYGLFSIMSGMKKRTVIYSPDLNNSLDNQSDSTDQSLGKRLLLEDGFSLPKIPYEGILELDRLLQQRLDERNVENELIKNAIQSVERNLPNLVSFVRSPIDQEPWERMSGTVLLEDEATVETGLFALTQSFLTIQSTAQLLSPSLFSQNADLAPLLLSHSSQLTSLLFRYWRAAPQAYSVRRTVLAHLKPFVNAIYGSESGDTEAIYEDLETSSSPFLTLMRAKQVVATENDEVQRSLLLYLLTLSVIPHMIPAWAIADDMLDGKTLQDSAGEAVTVVQDPGIGSIKAPPTLKTDMATAAGPIARALVNATAKYSRGFDQVEVKKNLIVTSDGLESSKGGDRWRLGRGDTILQAYWLADEAGEEQEEDDCIKRYQEGLSKLGIFHLKALSPYLAHLHTAFVAGFLKIYAIEPANDDYGTLPEAVFAPGAALPLRDIRVKIRRRDSEGEKH